ncbi:MAG: WD40 repeat domain-containing protein [Anaerolineae bacterium]|nr:WD40 repeat domain-containing protein [Anaerolineae bacterium]
MNRRLITLLATMSGLGVFAVALLIATTDVFSGPSAQVDPTLQKQTVDAAINDLFTQTAQAQQPDIALTQTVQAAFQQAMTATAAATAASPSAAPATVQDSPAPPGQPTLTPAGSTFQLSELKAWDAGPITSLVFSPDSRWLASGGDGRFVRLWDASTGALVREIVLAVDTSAASLAFSPDGLSLAVGNSIGTIHLYDPKTGDLLHSLSRHSVGAPINGVAFSPDGRWLASGSLDQTIRLWDVGSGEAIYTLFGHAGPVTGVAISPDNQLLASTGQDGTVRLWNVASGEETAVIDALPEWSFSPVFDPNGSLLLTSGRNGTIAVWNMPSGSPAALFPDQGTPVETLAYHPDGGVVASGGAAGNVRLWEVSTSRVLRILDGHQGTVTGVAFSPDGARLASGTDSGRIRLWALQAAGEDIIAVDTAATTSPGEQPGAAPQVYPTNTAAEVPLAEQVFERGRMFWVQPTRQIWVMLASATDPSQGDWFCYNDTYQDTEPETDAALVAPDGLIQPERGFGKLWRTNTQIQDGLGWATTPEFNYTSRYTYIPGGYVENDQYYPGPGEHQLNTLYGDTIALSEGEIRGDCQGGTWRITAPAQ